MAKLAGRKGRSVLAGMGGVVALSLLAIWGCCTSGQDTPVPGPVATKRPRHLSMLQRLKVGPMPGW